MHRPLGQQGYSRPIYQFNVYNDCIKRFKYITKYLFILDIDEFIIPLKKYKLNKQNKSIIAHIINDTYINEHQASIKFYRYNGIQ